MKLNKMKCFSVFLALCMLSTVMTVGRSFSEATAASKKIDASSITMIGKGGYQSGVFCQPGYLNVEQQRLYVSDSQNNRVQAFIRGNVFQLAFGGFGQNEREFDSIAGICSNAENLFVVDSANSRIQIFTNQGDYVHQFGVYGSKHGEMIFPTDIAISGNRLFVLDTGNHRIQVFDLKGKFLHAFGKKGNSDGELNHPLGIAVFEDQVFVSDTHNHRVQIFDTEGKFLSKFGWQGSDEAAFSFPKGIKIDENTLYIVDSGNLRIQFFTVAGVYKDVLSYEGFKHPFDIDFLENRIIVSDKEAHRVFVFEKNKRFHGIYGSTEDTQGMFVRPISIAASLNQVYVLDEVLQTIQVFDEKGVFASSFRADQVAKAELTKMQSIEFHDAKLYVLDSIGSKIAVFSQDGTFVRSFGTYGSQPGELVFPSDLAIADNQIFVADAGNSRVQLFDMDGKYIHHFGSYGMNDGEFVVISGISVRNRTIYVADTGNNRVQTFDYEGNILAKIGKRGLEIGSYYGLKGIYVDPSNKLYVADTLNNRIQVTDMLTLQTKVFGQFGAFSQHEEASKIRGNAQFAYDHPDLMGYFMYPMDIAVFQDTVIVADTFNHRVQMIKMTEIFGSSFMRLTPSYLDFGSISPDSQIERSFIIHNESGNILSGKVISDHPSVKVEPSVFSAPSQEIKVTIIGNQLESGKEYKATVKVELNNESKSQQEIDVVFRADASPDFYTELLPIIVASPEEDFTIPIRVVPQNGFTGRVSFIALGLPRNTTPSFNPPSIVIGEEDTTYLTLTPTSRMIEAGIYNIEIETISARGNIRRRASSTFVYKQRTDLVPKTVLGELFTAIWCINCVHSHSAMNRLYYELGKEKVVWLEYYVQSAGKDEPYPRLTCTDSELRLKWYQSDYGLPTIYFDGTDYLKGVPTGDDTRTPEGRDRAMYNAYRDKVLEKLRRPSVVSIGVQNAYDSQTKTGKVSATVRALDAIPFRDPRIYFVLTETNIPFESINGEKEHHFVVRDMLTPKNDDVNDYLGTPMMMKSGETFNKKGDVFTLEVAYDILNIYDISQMSLVVFVQDNVTKTVLQATEVPVKIINNASFNLISDQSLHQIKTKGEESIITAHLINTGTKPEIFDINVINRSREQWLFTVFLNGKESGSPGNNGLKLLPFESVKIEIKTTVPPNAVAETLQSFVISAVAKSSQRSQRLNSAIKVVEARPPGFSLSIEAPAEERIMAGDSISYTILVSPDPYFNNEIKLSLREIPDVIESAVFEPSSGIAPFNSKLTMTILAESPDRELSLELIASGGDLTRTQRIIFRVDRNPDALPPQLELAYPPENFLTNKVLLEISGRTDPTASLIINDKQVEVVSSGMFAHEFLLEEGQNLINVVSANRKGLRTEIIRIVTLDTLPPVLELNTYPEEITEKTLVIEGQTEAGAVVTIAEQDVIVGEDGSFSHLYELLHGFNSIEIIAIDQAGNTTAEYIEITLITLITLRIGSNVAYVNHKEYKLDAPPYIKNARTMVPLRFIGEGLGAEVEWDGALRQITLRKDSRIIRMVIGSVEVFITQEGQVGGTRYTLDAPPEIVEGRTFVPLRFISEAFGAELDWNPEIREITIKS